MNSVLKRVDKILAPIIVLIYTIPYTTTEAFTKPVKSWK